ncbi:conserved hypothetical protein [Histoplasma capsulatum var. duboisii H88]|uniref:Ribosomal protein S17 n=1 Tax=Ajellomyces capsulatus (strain H88) TaxID=544711 RepID=F0U7U6_AJEC8|nr:conserved hypothetical protein [Histoplasma capsulatum var. duboisii H88]QSS51130.1 hypothetical protein I7I53_06370 [Histoplasma capsulatum var. duboisii H88]
MTPNTVLFRASAYSSHFIPCNRATLHPFASLSSIISTVQLRPGSRQITLRTFTTSKQSREQAVQSSSTPPANTTTTTTTTTPPRNSLTRYSLKFGTVLTAGRMDKTVRVLHKHTTFHKKLHKSYPASTVYLVSDPCNSLRQGDVIEFSSGWRTSKNVRHVVEKIVAPFGVPVDQRPRVLSRPEREALKAERDEKAEKIIGIGRIKRLVRKRLEIEKERRGT